MKKTSRISLYLLFISSSLISTIAHSKHKISGILPLLLDGEATTTLVNLAPVFPESNLLTYIGAIKTPYGSYGKNTIEINRRYPNRLFLSGGGQNGDPGQTSIIELNISNLVNESSDPNKLNMATIVQQPVSIWPKIQANTNPNTDGYTVQEGGAPNGDHPIFNDMYYHKGATESEDRLYTNYRVFYAAAGTEGVFSIGSTPNNLATATFSPLISSSIGAATAGDVIEMNSTWQTAFGGKHLFFADQFVRLANGIQGGPHLAVGDLTEATSEQTLVQTSILKYTLQNPVWQDPSYKTDSIDFDGRDATNFSGLNQRYVFLSTFRGAFVKDDYIYMVGSSAGNMQNVENPRRFLDQATHESINGASDGRTPNAFEPGIIGTIDYKATDTLGHSAGGPNVYDAQDQYPWIIRYKLSDIKNAQHLYSPRPDMYGRIETPFGRYNGIDGYTIAGGITDGISGFAIDPDRRRIYLALSWIERQTDEFNSNPVIAVYSY